MLTPKTKRILQQIIPFGLIWLFFGWVFLIVELAASGSYSQLPDSAIKLDFQIFFFSSIAVLSVGLLTGFIELKYLQNAFAKKNLALRFLYKLLSYSSFFFFVILILFPIAASLELNTDLFDKAVWEKYFDYFISISHLSTWIQLAVSLILSLFYSEISEFIGQGVLINFFTGKYHRPIEEERIFIFLDMKSSTTIAEKLGHVKYFKLLHEYYNCFTEAIIEHEAEIYQYVGDEIILSWKYQGDNKDNRCIDCFYAMKENLSQREKWFNSEFGIAPSFKAGIHFGKVTTGEIGVIKKDIMFTGDVLNTTARIQGLCNSYDTDLIVSADLMKQLESDQAYDFSFLGEEELQGRVGRMALYVVGSK